MLTMQQLYTGLYCGKYCFKFLVSIIFRYMREYALLFKEHSVFLSIDDKHKVKVGEPNCPVAAAE